MTRALSQLNFRDLGFLPAADGRTLRPGLLYRAEGPASFNAEHRSELAALNIKLVCDLRAEVERRAAPNDWAANGAATAQLMEMEITADLREATNAGWSLLRENPSQEGAIRAMMHNYAAMPAAMQPHLRGLVTAIIEGQIPVLIHCTAGKDRTGVLMALLLSLLGVPREAINADYLRSDIFAKNLRLGGSIAHAFEATFGFTPSQETIDAMIGVDLKFLDAAFAAIQTNSGGLDAYFEAAGIDATTRTRLRDALLT
jgi:protein-tyrosine phosphatase